MLEFCLVKSELSYLKNTRPLPTRCTKTWITGWTPVGCYCIYDCFLASYCRCGVLKTKMRMCRAEHYCGVMCSNVQYSSIQSYIVIIGIISSVYLILSSFKAIFSPKGKRRNSRSSVGCSTRCWVLVIIQRWDLSTNSQKSHQLVWRCYNRRRSSRILSGK